MLWATFLSTLFYSASYPYIYAETIKVVPRQYISLESILYCLGAIIFCRLWNKYSDRLFRYYRLILIAEMTADGFLFADVLIRQDLKFYFLLNIIIFAFITKNLNCATVKMAARVHPTEKSREHFDNNSSVCSAVATLIGASFVLFYTFSHRILFVMALIGNVVDNMIYLYIYNRIPKDCNAEVSK